MKQGPPHQTFPSYQELTSAVSLRKQGHYADTVYKTNGLYQKYTEYLTSEFIHLPNWPNGFLHSVVKSKYIFCFGGKSVIWSSEKSLLSLHASVLLSLGNFLQKFFFNLKAFNKLFITSELCNRSEYYQIIKKL